MATVGIQLKLFIASLITSAALVGVMYGVMVWSVDRGMLSYVNQRDMPELQQAIDKLATYYRKSGSWQKLVRNRREFDDIFRDGARGQVRDASDLQEGRDSRRLRRRDPDRRPPPHDDRGRPPPPEDHPRDGSRAPPEDSIAVGLTLLDAHRGVVTGRYDPQRNQHLLPIEVSGEVVGWVVKTHRDTISDGFLLQFLREQREALALISVFVFFLSALLSYLFSRHLVGPIKVLATATEHLTHGDYTVSLSIPRRDELGQLARDFNELAFTLARNDEARKRWFADISHELRTPLAVLKGEIEAMMDGIRPIEPGNIKSLAEEVQHLTRLIEDLYELSNSDIGGLHYRKSELDLTELLAATVEAHGVSFQASGLHLELHTPGKATVVWADEGRIRQLLDNVLANAMKYTDQGGRVEMKLYTSADSACVSIDDSKPGVDDDQLGQLFDHLYRAEQSRNRSSGGSGLGLAICRRIVEAHKGTIEAEHSALGGVQITIELPLYRVE
ncbi:MAG: HAMP domain-containing protein [Halieaceae bacterium]|jgi:two-component system, OmpR family, sensor histidine kinase BaeS|nr:HAMP domain-containing protein [Halieaceae bacterium]